MREFFKHKPEFIGAFASTGALPNSREPEVAFIGRSNVGKSSLINAVFKSEIAKTSRTPGRTQTLNLFRIKDKLMVVDLPGYGFAKVSKDEKKKWDERLMEYLTTRSQLRRVFLLIDAEVGPKGTDRDMMEALDVAGVAYQIILTKTDKAKDFNVLQASFSENSGAHPGMLAEVLATSAGRGLGLDETRWAIYNIVLCKR